ncbi:hypothetical protein OIU84_013991 [Salix udensis]|uniref:Uncharacterized protein n=1 Tax=Salix udensis TaxID=889485 RepID=A0AAD6NRI0_9ROSI|nr:hypothetical protein OIU84_013991 [Salix udensis]
MNPLISLFSALTPLPTTTTTVLLALLVAALPLPLPTNAGLLTISHKTNSQRNRRNCFLNPMKPLLPTTTTTMSLIPYPVSPRFPYPFAVLALSSAAAILILVPLQMWPTWFHNRHRGSSKKGSASLPPKPPFRRSVSDLSPNNILSRSSSSNGRSSFQWLKKMRDSMNEINQWWDEIMPDTDEVFAEPCDFEEEAEKSGPEDNPY